MTFAACYETSINELPPKMAFIHWEIRHTIIINCNSFTRILIGMTRPGNPLLPPRAGSCTASHALSSTNASNPTCPSLYSKTTAETVPPEAEKPFELFTCNKPDFRNHRMEQAYGAILSWDSLGLRNGSTYGDICLQPPGSNFSSKPNVSAERRSSDVFHPALNTTEAETVPPLESSQDATRSPPEPSRTPPPQHRPTLPRPGLHQDEPHAPSNSPEEETGVDSDYYLTDTESDGASLASSIGDLESIEYEDPKPFRQVLNGPQSPSSHLIYLETPFSAHPRLMRWILADSQPGQPSGSPRERTPPNDSDGTTSTYTGYTPGSTAPSNDSAPSRLFSGAPQKKIIDILAMMMVLRKAAGTDENAREYPTRSCQQINLPAPYRNITLKLPRGVGARTGETVREASRLYIASSNNPYGRRRVPQLTPTIGSM